MLINNRFDIIYNILKINIIKLDWSIIVETNKIIKINRLT